MFSIAIIAFTLVMAAAIWAGINSRQGRRMDGAIGGRQSGTWRGATSDRFTLRRQEGCSRVFVLADKSRDW